MLFEISNMHNFKLLKSGLGDIYFTEPLMKGSLNSFQELINEENLDEFLKRMCSSTGLFSMVIDSKDALILITDRVRSAPIYYRSTTHKVVVSNVFDSLSRDTVPENICIKAREQFLHAGFVIGNSTIDKSIHQVEAGSVVRISKTLPYSITSSRYAELEYDQCGSTQRSFEELDQVVTECFSDLAERANGRQIAIPLSGGYDSRLCAMKLRELGYDNLFAFSYGVRGNKEAKLSQLVADKLNIPWEFIEYTDDFLVQEWDSEGRRAYRDMAFSGCSLPHYQDYFAINRLLERKLIDQSSVLVPGHTADFSSGGHLPSFIFDGDEMSGERLRNHLLEKHFNLWPLPSDFQSMEAELWLGSFPENLSRIAAAQILDDFNMRERQAKFIVNSCRVYDFYGLSWWLPFWDRRFVEFWCNVPLSQKKSRWWYKEYVNTKSKEFGLQNLNNAAENLFRKSGRIVLSKLGVFDMVRRRSASTLWNGHPLNPYVVLGREFAERCTKNGALINGCYTLNLLEETRIK